MHYTWKNLGLTYRDGLSTYLATFRVISQNPEAGEEVAEGTSVNVYISSGKTTVIVPDVVGKTEGEARDALEEVNLVCSVKGNDSDTVVAGNIISQDVKGGTEVDEGMEITIVVSQGNKKKAEAASGNVNNVQDEALDYGLGFESPF